MGRRQGWCPYFLARYSVRRPAGVGQRGVCEGYRLPAHLSICLDLPIGLCLYLFVSVSVCVYVFVPCLCLSCLVSACLSVSVCPSACVSCLASPLWACGAVVWHHGVDGGGRAPGLGAGRRPGLTLPASAPRSCTPTWWSTATTTSWTPRLPTWCPRSWPARPSSSSTRPTTLVREGARAGRRCQPLRLPLRPPA